MLTIFRNKIKQRLLTKVHAIFGILIIFALAFALGVQHPPTAVR